MADPSPPVSKYDMPPCGTSYVILRRSIGRLDLVTGQEEQPAFGAFSYEAAVPPGYVAEPAQLPEEVQARAQAKGDLHRAVCDYIAGMTDRFAQDEYYKLFDPYTLP